MKQTLVILLCIAVIAAGCATTRTTLPDGSIIEETDLEATIAMWQMALGTAQQMYEIYMADYERRAEIDAVKAEEERLRREENIAAIMAIIEKLEQRQVQE
mgnify:FL=1